MNKIDEEKTREEIKGLKVSRYFGIIKATSLLIGSIILFIAIQMPESILNKKVSRENISRERSKLVFDLIHNNKDYESILLELSVIEKAYPENDNGWLMEIKNIYRTKLDKSYISKNIDTTGGLNGKKLTDLRNELRRLYDEKEKRQTDLVNEISGQGLSKMHGEGMIAKDIRRQILQLDTNIYRYIKMIDSLSR